MSPRDPVVPLYVSAYVYGVRLRLVTRKARKLTEVEADAAGVRLVGVDGVVTYPRWNSGT